MQGKQEQTTNSLPTLSYEALYSLVGRGNHSFCISNLQIAEYTGSVRKQGRKNEANAAYRHTHAHKKSQQTLHLPVMASICIRECVGCGFVRTRFCVDVAYVLLFFFNFFSSNTARVICTNAPRKFAPKLNPKFNISLISST